MSPKKKDSYDEGYDDANDSYYNQVRYKNDSDYRKGHEMREFEIKQEANERERDKRDAERFSSSSDYSSHSDDSTSNYVGASSSYNGNPGASGKGCTIFIGAILTIAALSILTIAAGVGYFFVFAFLASGIMFLVIGFRM